MRVNPENADRRNRRRALRKQAVSLAEEMASPSWPRCAYPGCNEPKLTEDCCYEHSIDGSGSTPFLPNDGIIDWRAIEVARKGLRNDPVSLTVVEWEIAVAYMLNDGLEPSDVEERTGVYVQGPSNSRRQKIEAVRDVLRNAA